MQTGTIFDLKKYAINDGPGIRTTVFFSGCPLSCLWCHNPESQSLTPQLLYRAGRCIGCGACIDNCPEGAISFAEEIELQSSNGLGPRSVRGRGAVATLRGEKVFTDRRKCTRCQTCVTGGGVTFSGGEPLLQPRFLSALLQACRKQEIHTVVDTSGFANWNVLEQIRADVDLFLYDLKHMDSIRHRAVTGVLNQVIIENLRRLSAMGAKCIVRIPLIPGINDDEKNLVESGTFLASLPHLEGVELMGYHNIAQAKYEALGQDYMLVGAKPPPEVEMHHAAEVLRSYGLNVIVR